MTNVSINSYAETSTYDVQKVIEHSFNDLEPSAVTSVLKEFAEKNMLDELLACSEYIDIKEYIPILKKEKSQLPLLYKISFHEWLLTNPDERAFKIWKKVRERYKSNGSYDILDWGNSAALMIYANLPERLDCLEPGEWQREIDCPKLSKVGITFKLASDVPRLNKKIIENMMAKENLVAVELAALQGSLELVERVKINADSDPYAYDIQTSSSNWYLYPNYYIMRGPSIDVVPLLEAMEKDFPTNSNYKVFNLFKRSLVPASVDQLRAIWNKVSNEDKKDFFVTKGLFLGTSCEMHLQLVLNEGRIDVAEYLYSLADSYGNPAPSIPHKLLSKCTEDGKLKSAAFILKKNPELLEKVCVLYKDMETEIHGTVLELAIFRGKEEMADLLLSHGANTKSLESLVHRLPFVDSNENFEEAIAIAERILLRKRLSNVTLVKPGNNIIPTYL